MTHAVTVTVDGTKTNQVIDGFGVNANHRSWNSTELPPVLDALIDQGGMTLFRVIYDNADWESTNDNADSNSFNWTYYNTVYSSAEFTKLWDMVAYLNSRGITDGAIINFMGYGPAWLCGSANFQQQSLTPGLEDEWAEMITSALYYGRNTRGLQFHSVMPNNEPDTLREGIHLSGGSQYVTTIRKLAQKLDANGLGDLRIVGPDLTTGDTQYMPEMMADSLVMSKVEHFSLHSYGTTNVATVRNFINSSAFSDRTLWMTEYNVWCDTCDNGTRGTYDWTYCRGTANYLLNYLAGGATAGLVYEGYDSYYAHHGAWGFWGLFAIDNENAAVKTYTPRKNFYTVSQISKFVRPGAQRITVSGSTAPFTPLLAFKHTGLGQVTLVGINTSGSAATLSGNLSSMPNVTSLDLYYTSASANMVHSGSVTVNNGAFNATIPADCVFTLTGSTGANAAITSPTNGASFSAPAIIPITATATTSTGSIQAVDFFNGATAIGEDVTAPYQFTWSNVPMGDYILTAGASDTTGNIAVSAPVTVAVVGPLAQIDVLPTNATVATGGSQQFSAAATDQLGHTLQPQPAFSWSVNGGGTVNSGGLFTAGSTAGGPFNIVANSGTVSGTATLNVAATSGGTVGNTTDGTLSDKLWDTKSWINSERIQATTNLSVTTIFAKVGGITGKYKCAIYSGTSTQPGALLAGTAEVANPATGWQAFALTSSVTLTSGNYYWLAISSDTSTSKVYYSSTTTGALRWGSYTYGSWPNPIATTGGSAFNYCIYATGQGAPTLSSIAVSPTNPTVVAGATQQFTATGTYSDSTTQNLTSQVTWASSATTRATINSAGLVTGVSAGTTTISATLGGISTNTVLTVQAPAALASIAVTPTNPTVVAGTTQQFTATGTYSDSTTKNLTTQVTWTSSATARAMINSAGLATGVSAGIATISATLGGVAGSTTLTVTVQPTPPSITTTSLPGGTKGTAYSINLTGSGGVTPYSWSLTAGALPAGLALNSTSGTISGTPTVSGNFSVTAQLSDASSPVQTASKAFSFTIAASAGGTVGNTADGTLTDNLWDTKSWINSERIQATANLSVTTIFAKVGGITGKYKCAIYSGTSTQPGALLAGTAEVANPATGWQAFALTSSVALTTGNYYWLAIWSDTSTSKVYYSSTTTGALRWGSYTYASWPNPIATTGGSAFNYCIYATGQGAPTLSSIAVSPTNPTVVAGSTQQFTATGTYSDSSTQNLTTQVTWASSATAKATINSAGLATGVSAGTTTISATLAGVTGSTTLTVQPTLPSVTTTSLPAGTVGAVYSASFAGSGGTTPYTWLLTTGALPAGLTLNSSTGAISGTPTASGLASFTVQLTDSSNPAQSATKNLSIGVAPSLASIAVTPTNPTVMAGVTQQFTATGTYSDSTTQNLTTQVTWASSATARATINSAGLATGVSAGTTTISATLGGVAGSTTLTVTAQPTPPSVTTTSLPDGTVGAVYSASVVGSGGTAPYAWSIATGALPAGLNLNSGTGAISGTPTAAGLSSFTVQLADSSNPAQSATKNLSISVAPSLASIAVSPTNPTVVAGATRQFTATGTYSDSTTQNLTTQVTWASSATTRATINSAGLATGVSAGTTTISATLGGVAGSTTLTVTAQPTPPSVTTTSLPAGTVGAVYSASIAGAGGTTPYTWSIATGALPAGLNLNSSTGAISGTPTASGLASFTVRLTDFSSPAQSATKALSISVATATATAVSIWPSTAIPAQVDGGVDSSVELGVKFRSDVAGKIQSIRFYKASANTGTHVGNLWSSSGTLLATATFTGETSSGWQQVNFSTPVSIAANTVYVASYHCNNGHYSASQNYFTATGADNAPLHALKNGVSGGNGVYHYGTGNQFPNLTWNTTNYWVDVVFLATP